MNLKNFEAYFSKYEREENYDVETESKYQELVSNFQKDYNRIALENLTLDQMINGNNDRGFYHRLNNETKIIGSIDVRITNYGVFLKDGEIKPNTKFGNTAGEAALNFKKSIIDILEASLAGDKERVERNNLPQTLKYKLASIYNPEVFLTIYSIRHVSYFLECLGYENRILERLSYTEQVDCLLAEKKSNFITNEWSNHKFARLLYYMFGSPNKTEKQGAVFKDKEEYVLLPTKNYMSKETIFIEEELDKIQNKASKSSRKSNTKKREYLREHEKNMITGNIAEDRVMEFEKERLIKLGKTQLAEKIQKVSDTDDSLGYDIKSFNEDGTEKFIEVKSTTTDNFSYYISENEFSTGKKYGDIYSIYFVSMGKTNIEIREIKNPFSDENLEKVKVRPINFQVDMKFK